VSLQVIAAGWSTIVRAVADDTVTAELIKLIFVDELVIYKNG